MATRFERFLIAWGMFASVLGTSVMADDMIVAANNPELDKQIYWSKDRQESGLVANGLDSQGQRASFGGIFIACGILFWHGRKQMVK
ncbi:MAG: hypothetical protein FWF97_00310 [Alphaproteobacteria bacterium]|nr:hypothetical protein [Alphaproteobacteria bacterium]